MKADHLIKNIGLSTITFASKILSGSVVYIVLARLLKVADFGLLSFGVTFSGIIIIISEFGLSIMAQRDIPQHQYPYTAYIANSLVLKIGLGVLASILGLGYLQFFYAGENVAIGIIFIIIAVFTANINYFFSVFRALNRFKVESYSSVGYAIAVAVLIACFYYFKKDVFFISLGFLIIRFVQMAVLCFLCYKSLMPDEIRIDPKMLTVLAKESVLYGLHQIVGVLYITIDSQLIAYFNGNESLGLYQAFFRIILILLFVSDLLNNVFLPYLSFHFGKDFSSYKKIAYSLNRIVILLGLFLFVFINLFSSFIVDIIYSEEYKPILVLCLPLSLVMLCRILTSIYGISLTVSGNQRQRLIIVVVSLAVSLSFNLYFIPIYGIVGAAYVSLITHFVLLFMYTYYSTKLLKDLLLGKSNIIFAILTIGAIVFLDYNSIYFEPVLSGIIFIIWSGIMLFFVPKKVFLNLLKTKRLPSS